MTAITTIEHGAVSAVSNINAAQAAATREVLTARLAGEEYGLDILAVQEIRRYEPPTRIANAPHQLLGIMNLRGVIVPIVDLRVRLGLPAENGMNTVTVVVNVGGRTVGLVVDSVSDVVALNTARIQPRPQLGHHVDADLVVGLYQLDTPEGQRLLMLADLGVLLRDL